MESWHAYRRGLATNLYTLGSMIRRFRRFCGTKTSARLNYIKTPARIVTDAMKQLESTIVCVTFVQQASGN